MLWSGAAMRLTQSSVGRPPPLGMCLKLVKFIIRIKKKDKTIAIKYKH